ncbi:hypothetical protein [Ramlibacter sp. WS9]|uniref:hypothetical protein n=1 Tax=Ramlibacter sp. WS9 TaxID=1882741 RepID=UPI001144E303|nr:hypothetical protein [Ramlibacter sp. WS9]ROZ77167.1 hypothetical protein EEB15_10460 [Ramlibacter sp. WS9]
MLLQKTERARTELRPGVRTLGQRERSLLLLCDGKKSLMDLRPLFDGLGEQIVLNLMQRGYLEPLTREPRAARSPEPEVAAPSPPAPVGSADGFEGRRSLATTRMFLFDICERMFARRDPAQAERFREALRDAKDRESMLAAGREMIAEIERVAGHERADSISERIAMLLPLETV